MGQMKRNGEELYILKSTVVLSYLRFHFLWFQLLMANGSGNITWKIPEVNNSQVLNGVLFWSSMMKSQAILLSLAWEMNNFFVQHIHMYMLHVH